MVQGGVGSLYINNLVKSFTKEQDLNWVWEDRERTDRWREQIGGEWHCGE